MRFRIKRHNYRYIAQVYDEFSECWFYVGSAEGYKTKQEAEEECFLHKREREPNIKEFIL